MALFSSNTTGQNKSRASQIPFVFRRQSAGGAVGVLACSLCFLICPARADLLPQTLTNLQSRHAMSRSNYLAAPGAIEPAWKFACACFELADYATNNSQRASLAQEGIAAARFASEMARSNAAGHYYLALNLGQLARTRTLSALPLIRQMEESFRRAIALDPKLDHAGPDRSLGMLYLEAPGWPTSIGSKAKARQHLEKAVALEPDYPDNHLTLLEAYDRWNERDLLLAGVERFRNLLPDAKKKYSGPEWDQAWRDWIERWRAVLDREMKL